MDKSSFSNPNQAAAKHFHLTLNVDFKRSCISGNADFDVEVKSHAFPLEFHACPCDDSLKTH